VVRPVDQSRTQLQRRIEPGACVIRIAAQEESSRSGPELREVAPAECVAGPICVPGRYEDTETEGETDQVRAKINELLALAAIDPHGTNRATYTLSTSIVAGADWFPEASTAITVYVFRENGMPYTTVRV
jgi:hypothetical protein